MTTSVTHFSLYVWLNTGCITFTPIRAPNDGQLCTTPLPSKLIITFLIYFIADKKTLNDISQSWVMSPTLWHFILFEQHSFLGSEK